MCIRDRAPSVALDGVLIRLDSESAIGTFFLATSTGTVDSSGANYTYRDTLSDSFIIPDGSYILTATKSGYQPYTHDEPIIVPSNTEVTLPFQITPLPQDATTVSYTHLLPGYQKYGLCNYSVR